MFGFLNRARDGLQEQLKKVANKEFAEACMAGAAMIAWADGQMEEAEKKKLAAYIERSPELSVFDRSHLIALFNRFSNEFEFDVDLGNAAAMKEIGQVRDPEQKLMLARVLMVIARADGEVEPAEEARLRKVFDRLGLTQADLAA